MYRDEDDEDLRVEIFHLKKQLSNVSTENNFLKVKIRKLQNEIVKKDKQMDVMLDPRKTNDVRKILYERSASFVLNMKEKNDELLYLLREKDVLIRRLQNQLDITKLYSQPPKRHFPCKCPDHVELDNKIRQIQVKTSRCKSGNFCLKASQDDENKKKERSLSWTPGLHEAESTLIEELKSNEEKCNKAQSSAHDVKDQYRSLSRDHLLSIIENLKNNQRYSPLSQQTSSRKSSPESDLERIELLCESPHEEIQQLHLHFLDMISEVDHLKNTIAQLQNNQEKTDNVLRKKNTNIDKLAQEIKNLKRPKSRPKPSRNRSNRCYSSADFVSQVYSTNNTVNNHKRDCVRSERNKRVKTNEKKSNDKEEKSDRSKASTLRRKQDMKNAMVQVSEIDSPESSNRCVYIEKESITITQKATSVDKQEKEYDYEDEIFEECDDESVAAT
ncbi:hypothetical protein Zmor_026874 [Zophobas morio]|uniref:Uncharacterized protein n=1 Tax=Zophobas morio TaxID=2755281 RepID=A0AA38I049_9CUCU|nr:hypothetical protein Zmor_026874 [Zophobas morio]